MSDTEDIVVKLEQDVELRLKSDGTPLWRQLYQQITDYIGQGKLDVGMGLPSERELADLLQISRGTVRRCYAELRAKEKLSSGQGRGGSVLQEPQRVNPLLGQLKSFTQEMAELGKVATTQLEHLAVVQDSHIAKIFSRDAAAEFLHIIRVRYGDDVPMSREVAWYDLNEAPLLKNWQGDGSVYEFLKQHCDIHLQQATQTVEATLSTEADNTAFRFTQAQPCLLFKRKVFSQQHQLVEYVEGTFRGDLYVYSLDLY